MILTRDKGSRMWGGGGTGGSGGGGGLDPSALAGYASMDWVENNYVSKAFWNEVFEVRGTKTTTVGSANPVVEEYVFAPNELPGTTTTTTEGVTTTVVTSITNIKVKFGLWSSAFLSALGLNSAGGGGGGATALTELVDVAISSPTNGQVLMYNSTTNKWYNGTVQGGGGSVTSITAGTGLSGGTITASGTISINSTYISYISHGESAYQWMQGNPLDGYLLATTAASTYLSKTDAANTYLSKTDAASTYLSKTDAASTYVSIAFFSRLFQAKNGTSNVNPNNTTSTIDSIKAMFGFWTDQYLSALGQGSGGSGGAMALTDLVDVAISNPTNGQVLMYNSTTNKWYNGTVQGGGGGGSVTSITAGTGLSGGTITSSGTISINSTYLSYISHGESAYQWMQGNPLDGYLLATTAASTYLSKTDAASTYLSKTDAASTYLSKTDAASTYVSIAFFSRLFQAKNGTSNVNPNNTTSTIDSIKAMFGFWTDQYLSALGQGSGDGGSYNNTLTKSFTLPYKTSETYRYWHKLGTYQMDTGSMCLIIDLISGNGYNGYANQNSWARIIIKKSNTTSGTSSAVGVTCEQFGRQISDGKILVRVKATAYNTGEVWVKCPWGYPNGAYSVQGNFTAWTHNNTTSGDSTTAPTHNQNAVGYYDNTSSMSTSE